MGVANVFGYRFRSLGGYLMGDYLGDYSIDGCHRFRINMMGGYSMGGCHRFRINSMGVYSLDGSQRYRINSMGGAHRYYIRPLHGRLN